MQEFVFQPPTAILLIGIGIVVIAVASVFLKKGHKSRKITGIVISVVIAAGLIFLLYRPVTLTVDADGNVCVATIVDGGITVLSPRGDAPRLVPLPERSTAILSLRASVMERAS